MAKRMTVIGQLQLKVCSRADQEVGCRLERIGKVAIIERETVYLAVMNGNAGILGLESLNEIGKKRRVCGSGNDELPCLLRL